MAASRIMLSHTSVLVSIYFVKDKLSTVVGTQFQVLYRFYLNVGGTYESGFECGFVKQVDNGYRICFRVEETIEIFSVFCINRSCRL